MQTVKANQATLMEKERIGGGRQHNLLASATLLRRWHETTVHFPFAQQMRVGRIVTFFRWFGSHPQSQTSNGLIRVNKSHVHELLFGYWAGSLAGKRQISHIVFYILHNGADYFHAGLDLGSQSADCSGRQI